eukprot:2585474-Amphidinium_carterae.1
MEQEQTSQYGCPVNMDTTPERARNSIDPFLLLTSAAVEATAHVGRDVLGSSVLRIMRIGSCAVQCPEWIR